MNSVRNYDHKKTNMKQTVEKKSKNTHTTELKNSDRDLPARKNKSSHSGEFLNGMNIDVVNKENKKVGTLALPAGVFSVKWNPELVHQIVTAHLANKRNTIAHTKTRGEVAGGGKKPWRQKHTGRARHGSTRSPIWSGGGITHGPRNDRDFSKKTNKKMRQAALFSTLSKKFTDKQLIVVDNFDFGSAKTKEYAAFLKYFFKKQASALVVVAKEKKNAFLGARNIPGVLVISVSSLNAYECVAHKFIFIEKDAVLHVKKSEE